MLRAILNKAWWQHPTRHKLYGHLPPIRKTIQVRRTRHAGHCRRSRDELISDVLLWTRTYSREKAGRPARTYIQQLCEDTGCSPEDLPEAMNDREKWGERVRGIRASSTTWWRWLLKRFHQWLHPHYIQHPIEWLRLQCWGPWRGEAQKNHHLPKIPICDKLLTSYCVNRIRSLWRSLWMRYINQNQ